jgi:hypothetical protein
MKRIAVLFAAGLFITPLLAQERIYLYVSHRDDEGTSLRHKLECLDTACKLEINNTQRNIRLSAGQKQQLLQALQAEAHQFKVVMGPAVADKPTKVKFRYDTPTQRLEIERRLPADQPAALTPQMLQAIQSHLALDLALPLAPRSSSSGAMGQEAVPRDKDL